MTNFVVIVADDMRKDFLPYVSVPGYRFEQAFNCNPVCVSSRTTLLTGNRPQTTRQHGNNPPVGGFSLFDDSRTIATRLQDVGYSCGHFGKYLNDYNDEYASYIPPGWSTWWAITSYGSAYYNFGASVDGVLKKYDDEPESYLTHVIQQRAERFLKDATEPFFAYVAPVAPHESAIPSDRYANSLVDVPPHRPPSFNADGVKQPDWIRRKAPLTDAEIKDKVDDFRDDGIRTLQSVTELVAGVWEVLENRGVLDNTVIIFTSDNGMMFGEHKITGKSVPYLEATHAPFVLWASDKWGFEPNMNAIVQTCDIAPTLARFAEADSEDMDGRSLMPILRGAGGPHYAYVENDAQGNIPPWIQAVSRSFTYTYYEGGFEEMYHRMLDRYQLKNIAGKDNFVFEQQAAREFVSKMAKRRELPPGMTGTPV